MARFGASKHPNGISGPLKTSLAKPKGVRSCLYPPKVHVNAQIGNVVVQLCYPRRAKNLITGFCEQTDVVWSFFASNREINNQMFSPPRNFQRCLTRRRLALPAGH